VDGRNIDLGAGGGVAAAWIGAAGDKDAAVRQQRLCTSKSDVPPATSTLPLGSSVAVKYLLVVAAIGE